MVTNLLLVLWLLTYYWFYSSYPTTGSIVPTLLLVIWSLPYYWFYGLYATTGSIASSKSSRFTNPSVMGSWNCISPIPARDLTLSHLNLINRCCLSVWSRLRPGPLINFVLRHGYRDSLQWGRDFEKGK